MKAQTFFLTTLCFSLIAVSACSNDDDQDTDTAMNVDTQETTGATDSTDTRQDNDVEDNLMSCEDIGSPVSRRVGGDMPGCFEEACRRFGCGAPTSFLTADGCYRPLCTQDSDCESTEECRLQMTTTVLCDIGDEGCSCSSTTNDLQEMMCVPKE